MAANRLLSALFAVGLAGACGPASADSSDTARVGELQFGNGLDPSGASTLLSEASPDGMSWLHPGSLRTPSGMLYGYPPLLPDEETAGDWRYSGVFSLGGIGLFGDDDAQVFRQYTDWDEGPILELLALDAYRPETGDYAELRGSRLSDNDQYYRFRGGRYGRYKIEGFYRDLPHIISTTAFPLWEGIGSEDLTLPQGLTPGASDPAAVAEAVADAPRRTIRVDRSRTGLSLEGNFSRKWTGYVSLANEERDGTRLWGGTMFFNYVFPANGGIFETVRPIDFSTTDMSAGARYVGDVWRFNAVYSGSFFRNHKDRLDYDSPFDLYAVTGTPPASNVSHGQFSLEPDNDAHNLRLELSRSLRWNGELSLTGAVGTMRQDDDILAPLTCQGLVGITQTPFIVNCDDWNSAAALSQDSADARIDTLLLHARASFRPSAQLSWHAELRHYGEDNKTDYTAFNPLTGEYGYITENGSMGSVVPGEIGIFDPTNPIYAGYFTHIRAIPYATDKTSFELGGDWRPDFKNTFSLAYGFERREPEHRERSRVDESRITLAWIGRAVAGGSLRSSYEFADRTGDSYDYFPYEAFYSTAIEGYTPIPGANPFTVTAMRKYDLSNRRQHKLRSIFIHPVGEASTASAVLHGQFNDYGAQIGRQKDRSLGLTLQWDYQPGPGLTMGSYAGAEVGKLEVANVADAEAVASSDPSLGGDKYPFANLWDEDSDTRNLSFGLNVVRDFGPVKIDGAYSFIFSTGEIDYDYATTDAITGPQLPYLDQLVAFPDTHYRVHTVDLGLTRMFSERLAVRWFGRFEAGDFSDWHYLGFDQSRLYDHRIYTDEGPSRDFETGMVGMALQLKL